MAHAMGTSLESFRTMLSYFMVAYNFDEEGQGTNEQLLYCDEQRTAQFIYECANIKRMIKQYAA